MQHGGTALREFVDSIAAVAAEHADAEALEEPLARVVGDVVRKMESEDGADVGPLQEAGADDVLIGRLLRAVETEVIELLRTRVDGSDSSPLVLALRSVIRKSIPSMARNPEGVKLYQELLGGRRRDASPEERRILGLVNGMLANVRDLIFIHDSSGCLLYVNDFGLEMLRYTRQDLMEGLSIYDLVVSKYVDLVEERMAAPGRSNLSPFSIEVYAKDGERIPIEIDTRILRSANGQGEIVVGVARDLRLERRLQEDIRRTHGYVENLLTFAPMGVVIADAEGFIKEVNPLAASICGAPSVNSLIGLNVYDIGESDDNSVRAALQHVMDTQKDYRERISIRSRFGRLMVCDAIAAPLIRESGALDGLIIFLTDVSEQISLQRELLQSEKMSALGEIVARAAHELNNPLTGILGYAQYLHAAIDDPAQRERLERILEEAHHCRRIGDNLLAFAKRGERKMLPHDLNGLVREAYSLCQYALGVDQIQVSLDLAAGLPTVECCAQDLERAFLNLIKNAHQALLSVPESGRHLTISSRMEEDRICVSFSDTGAGVDPELAQKIFEPFFTTKGVGEGIGLGLSVAYAIASDHNGTVAYKDRPGGGSEFTFSLPVPK